MIVACDLLRPAYSLARSAASARVASAATVQRRTQRAVGSLRRIAVGVGLSVALSSPAFVGRQGPENDVDTVTTRARVAHAVQCPRRRILGRMWCTCEVVASCCNSEMMLPVEWRLRAVLNSDRAFGGCFGLLAEVSGLNPCHACDRARRRAAGRRRSRSSDPGLAMLVRHAAATLSTSRRPRCRQRRRRSSSTTIRPSAWPRRRGCSVAIARASTPCCARATWSPPEQTTTARGTAAHRPLQPRALAGGRR